MQKLQGASRFPEEKPAFIFYAMLICAAVSLGTWIFAEEEHAPKGSVLVFALLAGASFGICNILNTTLAALLDSAVFFPTANVGTILLTCITSALLLREIPKRRELAVITVGILAILVLNI